jgi:hypothetical protein
MTRRDPIAHPQQKAFDVRSISNEAAATFARFEGPDRFVVEVNGEYWSVTREFWRTLPIYQSREYRPDSTSTD